MMNIRIMCGCAFLALAVAATSAQTKHSFSGSCAKPDVLNSVPAGDEPDHTLALAKGKCTTSKGKIGDANSKEGAFAEQDDIRGNHTKLWGVYVETYDNGDKIFYNYQGSTITKDGAPQSGKNTYQAIGGTGKMKGIKGKGACNFTPGADGGLNYSCTGDYTLAKANAAK